MTSEDTIGLVHKELNKIQTFLDKDILSIEDKKIMGQIFQLIVRIHKIKLELNN